MESAILCVGLYIILVFLEIVPYFKLKQKKTVIFTITVMVLTLAINILFSFDVKIKGPTDLFENAISFIFKV